MNSVELWSLLSRQCEDNLFCYYWQFKTTHAVQYTQLYLHWKTGGWKQAGKISRTKKALFLRLWSMFLSSNLIISRERWSVVFWNFYKKTFLPNLKDSYSITLNCLQNYNVSTIGLSLRSMMMWSVLFAQASYLSHDEFSISL